MTEESHQRPSEAETPRVPDRYELRGVIGRGAFGEVYRAWDRLAEFEVALKVLTRATPDIIAELGAEFRVAASIRHPHVVAMYDFGECEGGGAYLTMQLLDCEGLDEAASTADLKTVLSWFDQTLSAIESLSRRGLLHGDIKPGNILVSKSEPRHAYLADFGLTQALDPESGASTGGGGTPAYMAPEVIQGGGQDIRSDLYALGMTFYEVLAGAHPFACDAISELLQHQLQTDPAPLDSVRADVNPALASLIARMMCKAPEQRFAAANEVIDRLRPFVTSGPAEERQHLLDSIVDPPLVARDAELEALDALVQRVSEGQGGALWIRGQAGLGCTALLEELRQKALVAALSVGRAEVHASDGIWDAVKRALALAWGSSERVDEVLGEALDGGANAHAIAGRIAEYCAQTPTVLLIDDLHEADDEVWSLVASLLHAAESQPLALVFTTGEQGADEESAKRLELTWRRSARAQLATTLELNPLEQGHTATLLRSSLGAEVDDDTLVGPLHDASGGRPGLLLELLRMAVRGGQVRRTERGYTGELDTAFFSGAEGGAGAALRALDDAKLEGLDHHDTLILESVVVLEVPATASEVAEVLGAPLEELEPRLEGLVRADLLSRRELENSVCYVLRHARLSQRVVERMDDERRQLLHGRCALLYFTQLEAGSADPNSSVSVAYHHALSGDFESAAAQTSDCLELIGAGNAPPRVQTLFDLLIERREEVCEQPVGWLVPIFDLRARIFEGAGRYEDALSAVASAQETLAVDAPQRLGLDRMRIRLLATLGRREEADEAVRLGREAIDRLAEAGSLTTLDRAEFAECRAELARRFSEPAAAREAAEEGLANLDDDGNELLRSRLLYQLAIANRYQSKFDLVLEQASEAMELADRVGDGLARANAAVVYGNAQRKKGQLAEAIETYGVAADIAATNGWVGMAGKCANNIAVCQYLLGKWEDAAVGWHRAVDYAELSGIIDEKIALLNNLGYLYLERGVVDRSDAAFSEGIELATVIGSDRTLSQLYGNLGELRFRQGELAMAKALYGRARQRAESIEAKADLVEISRRLAELALAEKHYGDAADESTRTIELALELNQKSEALRAAGVKAVAHAHLGEQEISHQALAYAKQLADGLADDSLDYVLLKLRHAQILEADGELEDAQSLINRVTERFGSQGAVWFEKEAREVQASVRRKVLIESRGTSGPDSANALAQLLMRIHRAQSAEEVATEVLEEILRMTGAARGTLNLLGRRGVEPLSVSAAAEGQEDAWGDAGDSHSRTVALGVLESGKELLIENVLDDDCLSATESVMAMELHSVLCMPVYVFDEPEGILYLDSKTFIGDGLSKSQEPIRALLASFGSMVERSAWRSRYETQVLLASEVAHELRSPMSSVLGYSQLAHSGVASGNALDEIDELLLVIESEAQRMNKIVAGMTEMYLASSSPETKLDAHRPVDIAERVQKALTQQAEDRDLTLINMVPPDLPEVLVDRENIQQCFTNLIQNALRHTPPGRRVFMLGKFQSEPERLGERPMVAFCVKDEGEGLNEENKRRVFNKFDRGSNPSGDGSGLGLSIVQSIVAYHGGKIWLESELGDGAEFWFTVPALTSAVVDDSFSKRPTA